MTQAAQVPARAPVKAGAPVAAIVPTSVDEAYRLAQAIAAGGLAPRGLDKPEQIMVAIMAGAEIGLPPFQALQSFAIVNGRPTLWGDGLMAVVRANGVRVREWFEGEGDGLVARCEVTRPSGEVIGGDFSVARARRAGLWAKQGPWAQYPDRMLKMRARAFALRDGCADILRGIQVREEVDDYAVRHEAVREVAPAETLRIEAAAPAAQIELVDIPPSDGLQAHVGAPDPEATNEGEGSAASAPGADEPDMFGDAPSMLDRMLAEIGALKTAHQANDYDRANERLIAGLDDDDRARVKAALQAKRSARG